MNLLKSLRGTTVLFSGGLIFLSGGLAAEKALSAPVEGVRVTIGTILATNQSNDFDPRLSKLKSQLQVFKYRSYRLIKEDTQRAAWQAETHFEIAGGRSLLVVPQESRNSQIALKVRLLEGTKPLADTTVRVPERGNFLLGGPPHGGGVLILSISAASQ